MVIPALPSAIKIWSSPSVVRRRVSVSLISWLQANALLCASASVSCFLDLDFWKKCLVRTPDKMFVLLLSAQTLMDISRMP